MAEFKTKVLIIGSGPAGYTAGIYASRAGLNPIIVSGPEIGGQLTLSEEVENYPGFVSSVRGQDLMDTIKKQTLDLGVKIITDKIVEVDFNNYPFECSSENNNIFYAHSIIIATGSSAKWLEIDSEKQFRGFGVSVCATCDGFFYRGKDVAVVGGGNTAAEETLYLTNFAKSVTLIHRRDELRAEKTLQEKLKKHPKINIKFDVVVEKVIGQENPNSVTGLILKNVKTDKTEEIKVDGLFVAIGHRPNTEIFRNQLDLDKNGYIITKPDSCATNVDGVFAAGDVKDPEFRQAIIAAGSGAMAAIEATRWLGR
jgi:thioredoxin reductase (NADPH)